MADTPRAKPNFAAVRENAYIASMQATVGELSTKVADATASAAMLRAAHQEAMKDIAERDAKIKALEEQHAKLKEVLEAVQNDLKSVSDERDLAKSTLAEVIREARRHPQRGAKTVKGAPEPMTAAGEQLTQAEEPTSVDVPA